MVLGDDEDEVVGERLVVGEHLGFRLLRADHEVHLAGGEQLEALRHQGVRDAQPYPGVRVMEPREDGRQRESDGGGTGGEADLCGALLPELARERGGQTVQGLDERHGETIQPPSGFGQGDARADPIEQRGLELVLELPDVERHGGLAERKVVGGA